MPLRSCAGPPPGWRGAPRPGGAAAGPAAGRLSAPAPAVGDRPAAAGHHDRAVCRLPAPGGGAPHGGGGAAEEPGPPAGEGRSCWPRMDLAEDALDDKPACPLCGDTGWRGTEMCRCLRALCAQEQIRELSSCWTWGSSPSTPSGWTITAPASGPNGAPPPGRTWSWCTRCVSTMPRSSAASTSKTSSSAGPGLGQDLPICLHRPHCVGERTFGGV